MQSQTISNTNSKNRGAETALRSYNGSFGRKVNKFGTSSFIVNKSLKDKFRSTAGGRETTNHTMPHTTETSGFFQKTGVNFSAAYPGAEQPKIDSFNKTTSEWMGSKKKIMATDRK